jgi:hypothetical protein
MSKCDIRIELDRTDHVYKIGDTVNCTVYVSVDKSVKCNSLKITNMWKTHGKGNKDSETIGEAELFSGEWQAGEYSYSYSFEIKEGPLTYRGHHINIDRYIKVRADIPWAIDPKAEVEYILETGGEQLESTAAHPEFYIDSPQLNQLRSMMIDPMQFLKYGFIASIVLIAIGGSLVYSAFFTARGFGDPFFGFILLALGIFIGVKTTMKKILHGKIGQVILSINPRSLRASDEIEVKLEFTPNVDIDVNKITISLIGNESATSGSGTNRTTYTHEFHKTEEELIRKGILMRDMPIMERISLEIPHDAAPTFHASNNSINWSVQASMDINKSPDWKRGERIEILI